MPPWMPGRPCEAARRLATNWRAMDWDRSDLSSCRLYEQWRAKTYFLYCVEYSKDVVLDDPGDFYFDYWIAEDPNDIVDLQDVADLAQARNWVGSEDLKTSMRKADAIGTPTIRFAAKQAHRAALGTVPDATVVGVTVPTTEAPA